jgi:hypothetical protein
MRHDTGTFVLALREARHHPGQVPSHLLLVTAGKELVGTSSAVQSTRAAPTGKGHRALATYVLRKLVKGKANWTDVNRGCATLLPHVGYKGDHRPARPNGQPRRR